MHERNGWRCWAPTSCIFIHRAVHSLPCCARFMAQLHSWSRACRIGGLLAWIKLAVVTRFAFGPLNIYIVVGRNGKRRPRANFWEDDQKVISEMPLSTVDVSILLLLWGSLLGLHRPIQVV
jgi:hypothetical protein